MRIFIFVLMSVLFPLQAKAQMPSGKDTEGYGTLAGVVLACGAYRPLYQFEEILSRYISNTAPSEAAEEASLRVYAKAKASSFAVQRKRNKSDCPQTIHDFASMPVFKFELYSDGSIKTPDGKFLYPRGQKKLASDAERIYPKPSKRKSK